MKKFFILVTVLSLLSIGAPALASDNFALIEKKCEVQWPNDYEMQGYCINMQAKAASNLQSKYRSYMSSIPKNPTSLDDFTTEQIIILNCMGKWMNEGIDFDYTMWEYCIDNQFKAARKLGKIK